MYLQCINAPADDQFVAADLRCHLCELLLQYNALLLQLLLCLLCLRRLRGRKRLPQAELILKPPLEAGPKLR